MTHPNKAFYNGMNEGGDGYNPYDYEDSPETQAALAADATRFAAEWTPEVTAERRAAWNAWVRTHPAGTKLTSEQLLEQEARQGWRIEDLKHAVKVHGE